MFLSRTACLFIAFVVSFVVFSLAVRAQDPSADQAKFWQGFQKTNATGDEKKLLNYIRRNKEAALDTFDFYFVAFATQSSTEVKEEEIKALALKMQDVFKNALFTYRLDSYLDFNQASRDSWGRAWNMFVSGFEAYTEGKENNNPYKTGEAMEKYEKSLEIFRFMEDLLSEADILLRLADCAELVGEKYQACVYLDDALKAFSKLPGKHNDLLINPSDLELLTTRHQGYLDQGYDPSKPQYDGGEPAMAEEGEGTEALYDDSMLRMASFVPVNPDEPYDVWKMSYSTMKGPDDFFTPSYFTGYNHILWPRLWFDSASADSTAMSPFYLNNVFYFGFYSKPMQLTYDDGTFFAEIDGNKKTRSEIRATTKPEKLVIRDVEKGEDKKAYECQYYIVSPSNQEAMFGLTVDNSVRDVTKLNLRLHVGWYTKGKILGETCMLIDDNCSGTLNELGYIMDSDEVCINSTTAPSLIWSSVVFPNALATMKTSAGRRRFPL